MQAVFSQVRRGAGIIIAVLSLTVIAFQLWNAWPQLATTKVQALPAFFALLFACASLALNATLWHRMLLRLGAQVQQGTAVRVWFASQIVRYAPGNVWHLLGRASLSAKHGLNIEIVGISLIIELLQTITSALVVAALSIPFWSRSQPQTYWLVLLFPLFVCYSFPNLIQYPLTWILRRAGRQTVLPPLRPYDLYALLPGYCLGWVLYGCGLFLLAQSLYSVDWQTFPIIAGSFAIAWVIGFLSFITPSGLGVREGVLSYLLSFVLPTPVAVLLALVAHTLVSRVTLATTPLCLILAIWRSQSGVQHKGNH
jgi:uncharacterized membrane protein YbhN (UPF0104 family)